MTARETENNAYGKILRGQTKNIMVCYGIFWFLEWSISTSFPGSFLFAIKAWE